MAGFLALKREKRDLQSKLGVLRNKLQGNREEQERLKGEQAEVTEWLKSLSVEARKLELEGVVIGHQVERLESELGKIDQVEKVTAAELAQLGTERAQLQTRLAESSAGILEIEERGRTGSEALRNATSTLETRRADNAALVRSLAAMSSAHAVKQERKSGMESELRRLGNESQDVVRRSTENAQEKESILARLADLQLEQRDTEARIEECVRVVQEAERDLEEKQKALSAERESLSGSEGALRALHTAREEALNARGRIEIEKARFDSDLEHLERGCAEEFHAPLSEIVAQIEEPEMRRDIAEVTAAYEDLRGRIENFGAINMRALEEYQELDERYQFLDKQRTDIEQSIADTQKAIAEINRRSIEQFQDAFKHIRENFMEVFQLLFRGGQCDLRLMDDGDVLESGIDIIAQPPGKRLQNVLLLSGGEKALTALALLIAIFRYRPSPFCVLDEVDAPLDDANVTRFTELLRELSKDTQFVVITHNKRTMEIAQTLYGVTMEEPGVSKIVSVDFRRQALAS
jgi:chromosome segregation protein